MGRERRVLPDGSGIRTVLAGGNMTMLRYTGDLPPKPVDTRGETKWFVPYTVVHPETVAGAPADASWVDVSARPDAYYGLLFCLWDEGETFALLEHDVVARPDVISTFEDCSEPWCVYGYDDICHPGCMEAWRNMLGCTRFRAEIIQAVPDAVSAIPPDNWDWHNVCDGLGENLRAAGFTHHWHHPAVHHHHLGR